MDRALQSFRHMTAATDSFLGVGDDTGLVLGAAEKSRGRSVRSAARRASKAKKKKARGSRGNAAPWVITLIVAAIAGSGGYYLFDSLTNAKHQLAEARAETVAVRRQAAGAEDRAMAASADLGRSEAKLEGLQIRVKEKAAAADALAAKLESIVAKGQGELVKGENGELRLQLMDKVLFKLGEANVTERGQAVLAKLGEALQSFPDKQVWVQGHTDDVPISKDNPRFKSNWELSSARALNVVQFLQGQMNVDPRRLAAVAFGEYRPVSRKRARNRRIEIVLFPKDVRVVRR